MNGATRQQTLLWHLRRLGLPGALGFGVIILAVVFLAARTIPDLQRLHDIDAANATLTARLAAPEAQQAASMTPVQQLAAFYDEFPQGAKIPDVLARINELAAEENLALELGEYGLNKAHNGRLDEFHITLPVKGTYPQVRKFTAAVLAAHPYLSLESLSLRREKVSEGSVEGRLVFLLFLEHAT